MSTYSAPPAERTKKRGKAISVLCLVMLLWVLAGCNGTGSSTVFGMIETPSAIRNIQSMTPLNSDNLANCQVGAVNDDGEIIEITGLDGGVMWSYPLGDQMFMRDLKGIAATIDLDDQWGSGIFGNNFVENVQHLLVLEFTFPETTEPTEINWFVKPHLRCRYEIDSNETSEQAYVWFEYLVYEEPLGVLDLVRGGDALGGILLQGVENEQDYIFEGDVNGTLVAFNDERSGTMMSIPQGRAKLFIGVAVFMRTNQQGDRIRLGGNSLPTWIGDSDRCTFDFGRNSYYTMRPAGND
jgi:hypothetical protein